LKLGKKLIFLNIFLFFFAFFFIFYKKSSFAQTPTPQTVQILPTPPIPCQGSSGCPSGVESSLNYTCASSYEDWLNNKTKNYWVNDEEVTYLGKQGERARQFTYWILTHKSIDNAVNIVKVWQQNRNIVYAFIILISTIFGITLMIQRKYFQKSSFDLKDKIIKIALLLLYTTFSFSITLLIIQLSDILSSFFIEKLGVEKIFNIFFLPVGGNIGSPIQTSEQAYLQFQGCRNLNINLTESVKTSIFLIKITNLTYFLLGIIILLRKILLWFLLILSPLLAVLIPFVFIRNIGWIWIGVFFQWVFYGPLVALFLGLVATIWNNPPHIPFNFDFSRINSSSGFIYQTGINILYGGPAQNLSFSNTSNYVDTFAEYVISLIMLWAVIFFPWWLLRIFRDYCCEGIMAMKNILLSMYDQIRTGSSLVPPPPPPTGFIATSLKIPKKIEIPVQVRLEKIEEIKKAKTEEISRSLNISASKLTDIAHFETNKQLRETVIRNLNYLQNPTQATTPSERQKYMTIRSELYNRAVKDDKIARQILSSISTSKIEQIQRREEILKSTPQLVPVTHVVSVKVKMPKSTVNTITSSVITAVQTKSNLINSIAQNTKLTNTQVGTILSSLSQNINQPVTGIIQKIAESTNLEKEKVSLVFKVFSKTLKTNKELVKEIAQKENLKEEDVEKIINSQISTITEPEKHIEETIAIPPTISIDDYEQVKRMWKNQYEKGEVPVTENITSREQWVENDILFITNTLNKLLSPNKQLQQEGLDDVGYILPIFLVNNLTGEQLIVYLKAKLEAAKEVEEEKQKEKEITEKLKAETEEMVEVERPKEKKAEKTMEMGEELKSETHNPKTETNPNDQNINDKNKSV
ncbi:MAG: hypothetical protein ACK4FL_00980, partial [Microgenomates group bacterium]